MAAKKTAKKKATPKKRTKRSKSVDPTPADVKLFVQRVVTNIKGGVDVELGPRTIIVGRKGTRKSTVVGALEFAFTHTISDIAGRDKFKAPAQLAELAPTKAKQLYSQVVLSDGSQQAAQIKLTWKKDGTIKASKATFPAKSEAVDADTVMPVRDLRAALTGAPATVQKYLFSAVCGNTISAEDIITTVSAEHHPLLYQFAPNFQNAPADSLMLAFNKSKARKTELEQRINSAQRLVDEMSQDIEAEPMPSDVEAAQRLVAQATEAFEMASKATAAESAKRDADALQEQRRQLVEELMRAEQAASQAASASPDQTARTRELLGAMQTILRTLCSKQATECPTCNSSGVAPEIFLGQLQLVESTLAQLPQAEVGNEALQTLEILRARLRSLDSRLEFVTLSINEGSKASMPLTQARELLDRAQSELQAVTQRQASWVSVKRSKAEISASKAELEEVKDFVLECQDAISTLLKAKAAQFVSQVQSYMPEGEEFGLDLDAGRIGLVRDGRLYSAASGGEWAIIVAAVASAMTRNSDTLSVIVPEDRALGAEDLTDVMRAFSRVPGQVILTATVEPTELPNGWTIIRTEDFEAPTLKINANGAEASP